MPLYGTHNSCTYGALQSCCLFPVLPWVRNQSITISEQLEHGIRWFDFRVSLGCNIVYLSHTFLMEHTLISVLDEIVEFMTHHPEQPFIMLHLRVDFHDLAQQAVIQPIVQSILSSYESFFIDPHTFDTSIPLLQNTTKARILCYTADSTLSHPLLFESDLMPTLYGWDAGSIDALEERLLKMDEFCSAQTQHFIYPKERMIIFDYSTSAPLMYTDQQQRQLMEKHRPYLLRQRPTIISGNHTQTWMGLFQS